jgi:hypothetical protein
MQQCIPELLHRLTVIFHVQQSLILLAQPVMKCWFHEFFFLSMFHLIMLSKATYFSFNMSTTSEISL